MKRSALAAGEDRLLGTAVFAVVLNATLDVNLVALVDFRHRGREPYELVPFVVLHTDQQR